MNERILIVDDHKNNIRLLEGILQDEGYSTFIAFDGEEAIKKIYEVKPDIILLDIMMPRLDGYSVCEMLQKSSETADIPIIMVTARVESAALKKALEAGAYDYIKKPIDELEVTARVASALKHKNNILHLKDKSFTDGLTGISNHSACLKFLSKKLNIKDIYLLAFVMIDIDFFKTINDTYGHVIGDEVLKKISKVIKEEMSEDIVLGRYGGDEFYLILSVDDCKVVERLCENIREKVENSVFSITGFSISITVSIGYTCIKVNENHTPISIIEEADKALYKAKKSGKNIVVNFS